MSSKKNIPRVNDEISIDIAQLSKKWWYFRKFIVFGTAIVLLSSLFILILSNKTLKEDTYIATVMRGDLGENNSVIIDSLQSKEIIDKVLKTFSLNLNANQFLSQAIITIGSDPLSNSLQTLVTSLSDSDIKRLSVSTNVLDEMIKSLNNTSDDIITLQLHHSLLNLGDKQAISIIYKLIDEVNKRLVLSTSNLQNRLYKINTEVFESPRNDKELVAILSNIIKVLDENISEMETKYQNVLGNVDLKRLDSLVSIAKKILFETSKITGSTFAIENIEVNIRTIERNIEDLNNSLASIKTSPNLNLNTMADELEVKNSFDIDGKALEKLLSIGSSLQFTDFRIKTLTEIQKLQLQKNESLAQKELFLLPFEYDVKDISLNKIKERIFRLVSEVNAATDQVNTFTQPTKAIQFIRNPEVIKNAEKLIYWYIKTSLILSLISFLCLSFIAFLIPRKS